MKDESMADVLADAAVLLGANIRASRKAQHPPGPGWSQEALAARMVALGHPTWRQTTVAKVEAGRRPVSMAEGISLAYALGLPQLDALYGDGSLVRKLLLGNFTTRYRDTVKNAVDAAMKLLAETNPGAAESLGRTMDEVTDLVYSSDDPSDPELRTRIDDLVRSLPDLRTD
ncbi:helix-turn-helix domain-containing protein [Nocardioides psychrotolerans]|nr:helix-turn-helix transcriptional regulator [Nocardioides psychrotolerans]